MPEYIFRPVRPEEIEQIAGIAVRAWAPIYAHYRQTLGDALFAKLFPHWQQNKGDQVRNVARARPDCVFVTECEGRVVGFTSFLINQESGVGDIGNNAVDPDFQGGGVGSYQHRQVLRLMRERGMRAARVSTGLDPAHAPARRSYEKAGFALSLPNVTYYKDLSDDSSNDR